MTEQLLADFAQTMKAQSEERFRHEGVALAIASLPPSLTGSFMIASQAPPAGAIAGGATGTLIGLALAIAYLKNIVETKK